MISHDEVLRTKREDILRIAAQYSAYNVRIFDSVARGKADEKSDIDFLVNMEPGRTLLERVLQCVAGVLSGKKSKRGEVFSDYW